MLNAILSGREGGETVNKKMGKFCAQVFVRESAVGGDSGGVGGKLCAWDPLNFENISGLACVCNFEVDEN